LIQFVWEFVARKDRVHEFERHYSSAGDWAKLFQKSPGYRGTVLLRDAEQPNRYVTIDAWDGPELYQRMRNDFAEEFDRLDRACEAFTETERRLGAFEVL
jgi:hypothetical protein